MSLLYARCSNNQASRRREFVIKGFNEHHVHTASDRNREPEHDLHNLEFLFDCTGTNTNDGE